MQFVNITVDTSGLYPVPTRDMGTLAIVGVGNTSVSGSMVPVKLTSYAEVDALYPTDSDLSIAIKLAFANGAAAIWAVDTKIAKTLDAIEDALETLETKDVQIVVIANTVETDSDTYISTALTNHVESSVTDRVGVFMLASGEDVDTMPTAIATMQSAGNDRMIAVAHNSTTDVAAAVGGILASLNPWESVVNKPLVNVANATDFTTTQMTALAAAQINYIFDPLYLAGTTNVLRTGYTLGTIADGIHFIDVRRTIDDISYKLKVGLTNPNVIGNLRINRSGISELIGYITGIMQPCVKSGEIDSFDIDIPIAAILAKEIDERTTAEAAVLAAARTSRTVSGSVVIEYSGAIHTLNLELNYVA